MQKEKFTGVGIDDLQPASSPPADPRGSAAIEALADRGLETLEKLEGGPL